MKKKLEQFVNLLKKVQNKVALMLLLQFENQNKK